jgi:hypothetical protein
VNTQDSSLKIFEAEAFFSHPQYKYGKVYFDAGIVVTKTPIFYNDFIRPICLPGVYDIKLFSMLLLAGQNKLEFNICR